MNAFGSLVAELRYRPGAEFHLIRTVCIEGPLEHDPPGFVVVVDMTIGLRRLVIRCPGAVRLRIHEAWQLQDAQRLSIEAVAGARGTDSYVVSTDSGDLNFSCAEVEWYDVP